MGTEVITNLQIFSRRLICFTHNKEIVDHIEQEQFYSARFYRFDAKHLCIVDITNKGQDIRIIGATAIDTVYLNAIETRFTSGKKLEISILYDYKEKQVVYDFNDKKYNEKVFDTSPIIVPSKHFLITSYGGSIFKVYSHYQALLVFLKLRLKNKAVKNGESVLTVPFLAVCVAVCEFWGIDIKQNAAILSFLDQWRNNIASPPGVEAPTLKDTQMDEFWGNIYRTMESDSKKKDEGGIKTSLTITLEQLRKKGIPDESVSRKIEIPAAVTFKRKSHVLGAWTTGGKIVIRAKKPIDKGRFRAACKIKNISFNDIDVVTV